MNDENLVRFIDVAKQYGLVPAIPVSIDSLRNADLIEAWYREKGMLAFSLREPQIGGSVLDVLVRADVPFDQLWLNADAGELYGRRVPIASIDDLITMKRIANRPKDRLDVVALQKSGEEKTPMCEIQILARASISEHLMLSRLARSEQMREFFIAMWLQNPALARQGGRKVENLLSALVVAELAVS
ncbi:MAG: hypothetical protein IPJ48_10455 [Propionivibrio sp.]|uniref:Uncharacterized protein n=1 Tax=Candidatus Propionivibrio dominans TaxID=2954373 RepID=A0A9D7F7B2_9RHOO|nr:hypothetical protein [Candidatus Propionivibrio dominans]